MTQSIRSTQSQYAYSLGGYFAAHESICRWRSAFAFCTISTISSATTAARNAAITVAHTFAVFVMAHSVQGVAA